MMDQFKIDLECLNEILEKINTKKNIKIIKKLNI